MSRCSFRPAETFLPPHRALPLIRGDAPPFRACGRRKRAGGAWRAALRRLIPGTPRFAPYFALADRYDEMARSCAERGNECGAARFHASAEALREAFAAVAPPPRDRR